MDAALKGHPYVKSGIDIACWDILGQAAGLPVCDAARRPLRRRLRALPRDLAGVAGRDGAQGRRLPRRGLPPLPAQGRRRSRRGHRAHPRGARGAASRATCWWPTPTRAGCRTRRPRVVRAVRDVDVYIEQPCLTYEEMPRRPAAHRSTRSCSTRRSTAWGSCCAAAADLAMDVVNLKISKLGGLTRARQARDLCVSLGIAHDDRGHLGRRRHDGGDRAPGALDADRVPLHGHRLQQLRDRSAPPTARPQRKDGRMAASTAPGLGVTPRPGVPADRRRSTCRDPR